MRARLAAVLIMGMATAAGCSEDDGPPPVSFACTTDVAAVARALERAPGEVRLEDGTPLSECVRNAESDSELQTVGLALTRLAEDLEADAGEDPEAALRLGYLVGAARRGAPSESALQAELVYRLERSAASVEGADVERALAEGMRAGEARG